MAEDDTALARWWGRFDDWLKRWDQRYRRWLLEGVRRLDEDEQ